MTQTREASPCRSSVLGVVAVELGVEAAALQQLVHEDAVVAGGAVAQQAREVRVPQAAEQLSSARNSRLPTALDKFEQKISTALDKAMPVNFLLHVYWNLRVEGSGADVLGHTLRLHASRHAVLDDELLPRRAHRARGRHAAGLPGAHAHRLPHPPGARHAHPRRRVQHQLHHRRRRKDDSAHGGGLGLRVGEGAGSVGEPAHHVSPAQLFPAHLLLVRCQPRQGPLLPSRLLCLAALHRGRIPSPRRPSELTRAAYGSRRGRGFRAACAPSRGRGFRASPPLLRAAGGASPREGLPGVAASERRSLRLLLPSYHCRPGPWRWGRGRLGGHLGEKQGACERERGSDGNSFPRRVYLHERKDRSQQKTIINSMAVNEDGVLATGGDNGSLWFWDWKSGHNFQQDQTIVQPGSLESEACIYALSYDVSGSRLVTCEADKTMKMWKEDLTATPETHPINFKPPKDIRRY